MPTPSTIETCLRLRQCIIIIRRTTKICRKWNRRIICPNVIKTTTTGRWNLQTCWHCMFHHTEDRLYIGLHTIIAKTHNCIFLSVFRTQSKLDLIRDSRPALLFSYSISITTTIINHDKKCRYCLVCWTLVYSCCLY